MQKFALFIVSISILLLTAESRAARKEPIILNEDSWTQLLQGEWMVDFYAPWCPACKNLEPEWKKLAEWSDDLNINVASADITVNPGLSGRFLVSALPTIYHVKDGIFRLYSGPREHNAMINFVEEYNWRAIEPVSRWLAPDSLQMSCLAYGFRISLALRDVHNFLVEEVGFPYYISYLVFALCTVTLGTILGLLIVFVIDQFVPSRPTSAQVAKENIARKKKTDKSSDSDLDDGDSNSDGKRRKTQEHLRKRLDN